MYYIHVHFGGSSSIFRNQHVGDPRGKHRDFSMCVHNCSVSYIDQE